MAFRKRSSAKLQALHTATRRLLFQLLVCRTAGDPARHSSLDSLPAMRLATPDAVSELLDRCARPAASLRQPLFDTAAGDNPQPERTSAPPLRRGPLKSAGWFCWWNADPGSTQDTPAHASYLPDTDAVRQAEIKLQSADVTSADQLMQTWLSGRFGGGSVAVLSCQQWLLLARLAFLRDDLHSGLMFLDRAASARTGDHSQSADEEFARRLETHELLLRAAAATMSGCPELSHVHLQNAEMLGNVDDPQELQLTMICRALVELATHRSQSACRLFQAALLLKQAPGSHPPVGSLLKMQDELLESLQLLAETQKQQTL